MQASAEVEGVIRGWFEAVARGDISWLEQHLSDDERLRIVGTDPAEWLRGDEAVALMRADLAVLGGKVRVEVNDLEAYCEGSVGWGVARPRITLEDGTTIAPRWSGVFVRQGDTWKAVQVHASLGVSNEEAFGTAFLTEATAATT